MKRVRSGDVPAMRAIYDEHAAVMLGVATRILGNPRDAEDLLHDAFIEAWQKAGDFDSARGSLRAWLIMRLRSRALDRLRSLRVAAAHAKAAGLADAPSTDDRDPIWRELDALRTRDALCNLSAAQREVIELAYFEGLSLREIAERSSTPLGTIKSRASAALAQLRKRLETSRRRRP